MDPRSSSPPAARPEARERGPQTASPPRLLSFLSLDWLTGRDEDLTNGDGALTVASPDWHGRARSHRIRIQNSLCPFGTVLAVCSGGDQSEQQQRQKKEKEKKSTGVTKVAPHPATDSYALWLASGRASIRTLSSLSRFPPSAIRPPSAAPSPAGKLALAHPSGLGGSSVRYGTSDF